jgi:hypothetical protein
VNGTQEPVLTIQQGVGPFPIALAPDADTGTLNAGAIQQEPPRGAAVERIVPPNVQVQAQGEGAQAFNKLIDFGGATIKGNVTMGDLAGGNLTKIDIKVNTADAAAVDTKAELLKQITQLQSDIAALKKLSDDDHDDIDDIEDALRKAEKAGSEDKKERLIDKLDTAQQILLKLGNTIPAALKLGETIGVLIQRAMQTL